MENKKKKVALQIILIIAGLGLIISGLIKISGGLKGSSKVSNAFINKFNEIQNLSNEVSNDMKAAGDLLLGISNKENVKDYVGAAKDIKTSISKLDEATSKINSLNTKISEFKVMVEAVTDSEVKQSGLKLISLLEQKNAVTLKLINNSKQLIEPAKTYYEALAAGMAGVYLDNNQVAKLTQEINEDNKTLSALIAEINVVNQDLAKVAGFQIKTSK